MKRLVGQLPFPIFAKGGSPSLGLSALFLFFVALAHAPQASAAIKFVGVSGASNYNITSGTSPIIYGGMAGTSANGTECSSVDGTCDGCAGAITIGVCNRHRISPATKLTLNFQSDTASGRPFLIGPDNTLIGTEGGSVDKGSVGTVQVTWGDVCTKLTDNNSTCRDSTNGKQNFTGSFKVGIDVNGNGQIDTGDDSTTVTINVLDPDPLANGDYDTIDDTATNDAASPPKPGISGFLAYPGDQKIYLDSNDIEAGTGFPSTQIGTLQTMNVYWSTSGFILTPAGQTPKSINISKTTDGYSLDSKSVTGMPNNQPVYLRVSVSDPAGNELFFTSDASIVANCGSMAPTPPFDGTAPGVRCPFAAVPQEVAGLLNKDLNCFIATAAFGSPFHPIVKDLRDFRDRFLKTNSIGRSFVRWYYSWSPPAAEWLRENPVVRKVVQALLVPVWLGTLAAMWWPYSILAALITLLIWRHHQRDKRGQTHKY